MPEYTLIVLISTQLQIISHVCFIRFQQVLTSIMTYNDLLQYIDISFINVISLTLSMHYTNRKRKPITLCHYYI